MFVLGALAPKFVVGALAPKFVVGALAPKFVVGALAPKFVVGFFGKGEGFLGFWIKAINRLLQTTNNKLYTSI